MLSKYKCSLSSSNLKRAAKSLAFANQVHSTRKTITDNEFSYFDSDGNLNPDASPFKRICSSLVECFDDIDGNNVIIEISIKNLTRILEDRSNLIWSSRLSDKAILSLSAIYYKEILELHELLKFLSQKSGKKTIYHLRGIFSIVQHLQQTQLPLLITRLLKTIDRSVLGMFSERLKTYLRSNTGEFLIYAERGQSPCKVPGQQFLSLLPCNDLIEVFKKCVFPMRLRKETLSSFVTSVFNSLLHSLLDSVLEVRCPFDESGLYRLFRVMLHLQEFALRTKKLLQSEDGTCLTTVQDRLLSDLSGWRRAEFAVAVLNGEVFRGAANKQRKGAAPVTVTMKNTRRWKSGRFLMRFCCVPRTAQEESPVSAGLPQRDSLALPQLPEALHQKMRFALVRRSSSQQRKAMEPQDSLLIPVLRPSWDRVSENEEDDDKREERRRWAALVAPNTFSARRILDSAIWGTWRRTHRGTVFVELKMDFTDI